MFLLWLGFSFGLSFVWKNGLLFFVKYIIFNLLLIWLNDLFVKFFLLKVIVLKVIFVGIVILGKKFLFIL